MPGIQSRQHVGLVLAAVHGTCEQRPLPVPLDPRVVTGDERGGAGALRQRQHRVEAHEPVAPHAWVRRAPLLVLRQEVLDDGVREPVLHVERDVRKAHRVRERAGADDRLRRAAALGAVHPLIGPQLERHGHDLVPGPAGEQRGGGTVHAPAHPDQHAVRRRIDADVLACPRLRQAAVQRVCGEIGRVALAGREPAELGHDPLRADPRRLEQGRILGEQRARAGGRERRAAALGVEGDLGHPAGVGPDRDPHQVAAHMPAGAADERAVGHRPAAMRLTQCCSKLTQVSLGARARRCSARGRGRGDRKPAGQGWGSTGFQVSQGTRRL